VNPPARVPRGAGAGRSDADAPPPVQFRNLVFEGGGVKGLAYVGAMQILENRGILEGIRRCGGASAGAVNALAFALGFTIREQRELLASTDFSEFMDRSFGVIRDVRRLAREFGYHKGDAFREWVGALVEARLATPGATFRDLAEAGQPDLHVIGTNLSTGFSEVFSVERHPEMALVDAVRISMSIPLFFRAVRHGPREDVYVDGGMQLNYPVKLFDRLRYVDLEGGEAYAVRTTDYYNAENARMELARPGRSPYLYNRQTLGMRLDTTDEIARFRYGEPLQGRPIRGFTGYARALFRGLLNVQENLHLHSDDWQRTVYIDTLDVGTLDFRISEARKEALVEQGIRGAERYFTWFEDPAEAPANRVPGAPEARDSVDAREVDEAAEDPPGPDAPDP
jgi:NTE family protein